MAESNSEVEARMAGERAGISIAVLGPGLNTDTAGSRKRRQIHAELERDGHNPFFPESYVASDPTRESLLEQERRLLGGSDVHLVVILHTAASYGTIAEIAYFTQFPEILAKSAILFPINYYTPDESLVANTVREYHIRIPYSDDQFDACQLVAECRKWARDRAMGRWPVITNFGF